MLQIGGIVVLFAMVFGGFLISGGSLGVIFEALPHEMMTIGGAAIAALLIGGSMSSLKKIGGDLGKVISGPKWKPTDYRDLLCLLFLLTKTMKTKGLIALEAHIEKPEDSSIFKRYPRITQGPFRARFHLRHAAHDDHEPRRPASGRDRRWKSSSRSIITKRWGPRPRCRPWPTACRRSASSPPCLGVIKTMGAISEPPEVLGRMIGSALVGTFLGVFLAYGIVGPMATRLKAIVDEDALFYHVIRDILVAHLHGNAAQVSVEIGRGSVPTVVQPSFKELEEALDEFRRNRRLNAIYRRAISRAAGRRAPRRSWQARRP